MASIPPQNANVFKRAEAIVGARVVTEDPFIQREDMGHIVDAAWAAARGAADDVTGTPATKAPDLISRERVRLRYPCEHPDQG